METLNNLKVHATVKDAYLELFDNITAMLLAQGLDPKPNREEMYITFDNKKDFDVISGYVKAEVDIVFSKNSPIKRYRMKQGKKKTTINFIVVGKWE